jgi:hypothetical protein
MVIPSGVRPLRALLGTLLFLTCASLAHAQLNLPKKALVPNEPADVRATMQLGASVAIIGGRAVVGAPGTDGHGAVYVFDQSGSSWSQTQKILPTDLAPGTFGAHIAFDEATILISDPTRGRVYYYEKRNGTGPYRATAILSGGAAFFGTSLALDGCNALISSGATYEVNLTTRSIVHLLNRCDTGKWVWVRDVGYSWAIGDKFGYSVAMSGIWRFIGGPEYNLGGGSRTILGTGSDFNSSSNNAKYGYSVDVRESFALVGLPGADNTGAVEILGLGPEGRFWNTIVMLNPTEDAGNWSGFGSKAKITPNRVLVTAQPLNADSPLKARIFIYKRTASGVPELEGWLLATNSGSDPQSRFGADFSVAGRTLLVGEPGRLTGPGQRGGGADVYQLPP